MKKLIKYSQVRFDRDNRRTSGPFRLYVRIRKLAGHGFNFPDFFDLLPVTGSDQLTSSYAWSKTIEIEVLTQPTFALDNSPYYDINPDDIMDWRASRGINHPERWANQFSRSGSNRNFINNPSTNPLAIQAQLNASAKRSTSKRGYSTLIMGKKSYSTKPEIKKSKPKKASPLWKKAQAWRKSKGK